MTKPSAQVQTHHVVRTKMDVTEVAKTILRFLQLLQKYDVRFFSGKKRSATSHTSGYASTTLLSPFYFKLSKTKAGKLELMKIIFGHCDGDLHKPSKIF
uniref:Ovule protein n=1 Tax=Steinernema glaseri TaxID=37863 RepID=A0A1I7ZYE2_9BILA